MRPDCVGSGGFDSHTFPPRGTRASRPVAPPRVLRRLVATLLMAIAASVGSASTAASQRADSVRAAVASADTLLPPDLPEPPISPRRAFVTSLLLPGYAQARLDRPTASAVFFGIEAASVLMLGKSLHDLRVARRFRADSIPLTYELDEGGMVRRDERGDPVVATWTPGRYTTALVRARRLQVEDWLAAIVFNHLFAGAEAFVSAHLWDVPAALSVRPTGRGGAAVSASIRW